MGLAALVTFKAILYVSIYQATKVARAVIANYDVEPGAYQTPFLVYTGADKLGSHMEMGLRDKS